MINPEAIGAAGFLVTSADELNTIPPYIIWNYYIKASKNNIMDQYFTMSKTAGSICSKYSSAQC